MTDVSMLEKALEGGALQLRSAIDAMPHLVWMADVDGNCDFLNKRWEEYTGIAASLQLGRAWVEQVHPDDREHVLNTWLQGVKTGSAVQANHRIRRFDGSYRWFDARGVPLRDAQGRIVKWCGTSTDIHDAYEARQALSANEERLRFVTLATHDSIYDWDMRSGNTYRNEEFQIAFGAPPKTQSSDRWWEQRIHPDDRKRVVDSASAAFRARAPKWSGEYRLLRADGEHAIVNDRAYLLYDANRKPSRMIGAIADITERKRAEQSLHDAQARLLSAIEGADLATWIWDIPEDRLHWDEAAYPLWGRTLEELGDHSLSSLINFIHPDDRHRVEDTVAEFFRTGVANIIELRTLRPDGRFQWLQIRSRIERDAAGQPIRMAGVYLDITERKQVEQSLHDAQARLTSVMQAAGMASWIWDVVHDEIYWGEDAYRLWGLDAATFGKISLPRVIEMMHPDDRAGVAAASEEFFRTGIDTAVEFRTLRTDGALQWLLVKGQVERDADGKPARMVGIYLDITNRKLAEEAQLRAQKMEALGTLAGGIAHDFNNLLLAISGNVKLAMADLQSELPSDHAVQRNLAEIDKASTRAADLVRRILTFSRQEEIQRDVMHLSPLIEEVLSLLRPTLPASVDIRTSYSTVAPIATDAIQIQQVIMNLVTNAAHAIGEQWGAIEIGLSDFVATAERGVAGLPVGRYTCLTVRDTGCGIEQAIVDRIFDPFFTTKQAGQGTGLGLAVVHGIVKGHGGAIVIESAVGKGAAFQLFFPAAAGPETSAEAPALASRMSSGESVLYVDDEEALVYLVSRVLDRLGYLVTGFVDPVQAIKELQARPHAFDVVVTDLSMRGMNGFELTREVRKIRADLPVLLTSGYLRAEDRESAHRLGIHELILKPNTVEELGQAIDRALADIRGQKIK